MGTQLNAQCVCGYQAEAVNGSGKVNHGKYYGFPYRCNQCQIVMTVDLLQENVISVRAWKSILMQHQLSRAPCRYWRNLINVN